MSANDARYVAMAFCLVLLVTVWGVWPRRGDAREWIAARMTAWACSHWGHDWTFYERHELNERWAVCGYCGARERDW